MDSYIHIISAFHCSFSVCTCRICHRHEWSGEDQYFSALSTQLAKPMARFTHHSEKNHFFVPSNHCPPPLYVAPPHLQITFNQIFQHERWHKPKKEACRIVYRTFWMQMAADSMPAVPRSLVLYILFMFLLSSFNFALRRPWRALSATWMILTASSWLMSLAFSSYRDCIEKYFPTCHWFI